jgi:hypothetical protein
MDLREILFHLIHILVHVKQSRHLLFLSWMVCHGVHWKFWRSLQWMSSSTGYRIVGALTLWCSVKYTLVKYVICFNLNYSTMQPSTLALLPTIALSFFRGLSMWYIHLYCCGPPTLASYGRCISKCCIGFEKPSGLCLDLYVWWVIDLF